MNQTQDINLGEAIVTLVSTLKEFTNTLDIINRNAVSYPMFPMNLENCTNAVQSAPEGGIDLMAYKRERVYLGLDDNGKPLHGWVEGKTEDERDMKKFVAILKSGRAWQIPEFRELVMMGAIMQPARPAPEKSKTDFCEYADKWYDRYKKGVIKDGSSYQVNYRLKVVKKFFQDRFLEDITSDDIQDFMNSNSQYGHKTLTDFKGVLHDLLQHAEEAGDIEPGRINWKRIKNPGKREKHRKAQTNKHYSDIVAHIPDLKEPMEQIIVAVFAYLGLRPEEMRGLRWEDIDLEAKRLYIERVIVYNPGVNKGPIEQEPKTRDSKTWLPISDGLYPYLAKHKKKSGWIVHEPDGSPIQSDHHWQKVWKGIGKQINLYGMKACEFRRTVATVMVSRGADVKTTQRMLRHSTANTTMNVYAEVEPEAFLEGCNRLGV